MKENHETPEINSSINQIKNSVPSFSTRLDQGMDRIPALEDKEDKSEHLKTRKLQTEHSRLWDTIKRSNM
jgi:hypothetical protein